MIPLYTIRELAFENTADIHQFIIKKWVIIRHPCKVVIYIPLLIVRSCLFLSYSFFAIIEKNKDLSSHKSRFNLLKNNICLVNYGYFLLHCLRLSEINLSFEYFINLYFLCIACFPLFMTSNKVIRYWLNSSDI